MLTAAFVVLAIAFGAALHRIATRASTADLLARAARLPQAEQALAVARAELEHERAASAEKIALLNQAKDELQASFKALSLDALRSNSESFMQLAQAKLEQKEKAVEHLVAPIKESLQKVEGEVKLLEQARREAYGSLVQQLDSLSRDQGQLRIQTANLVTALRAPHVRGRWGEMQLKRVVEMAGMLAHCDFVEQRTATDADGRMLRPDLVVKLPAGKNVVVDAKAPLHAYLDALEATDDDVRRARMSDHARQVREHIHKLGAKAYWQQFSPTPDFVVMFLPDETFFKAALEHEPALIEVAVQAGVIPATPTTLIALLRTVAYGWQQETVAESARAVSELGRELYARVGTFAKHLASVGRGLDGAVGAFNQAVGSLESRVLVAARRFEEHGIGHDGALPELRPIEKSVRPLQALELTEGRDADEDDAALSTSASAA